jgi:hypothetical protein
MIFKSQGVPYHTQRRQYIFTIKACLQYNADICPKISLLLVDILAVLETTSRKTEEQGRAIAHDCETSNNITRCNLLQNTLAKN